MQVLIVDDSDMMRHLLVSMLRSWNYDTVAAADGAEAWELFQQHQYPLILTDWMMPHVDGLELIRRIRAMRVDHYIYIVLLTARGEKEDLVAAMEAGADDFVAKPIDRGELRVRVHQGERMIRLERTLAEQNRQLRDAQAALVQSEKLASLGQLAAGMAHEINNPVAFVANNLSVLKRDLVAVMKLLDSYCANREELAGSAPQLASELQQLEQDCDLAWVQKNLPRLFATSQEGLARIRKIVLNLRDFAHLDEAEWNLLDLNTAVQSVVEILKHECDQRQLQLQLQLHADRLLSCRPRKIKQVVHSLLLNAIQASRSGGTITLRTSTGSEGAVLEVVDEGVGIQPDNLGHIFEPFYTTRPPGQGSGLGLSICWAIVQEHGGTIDVDSQPGSGSTFRVHLPWPGRAGQVSAAGRATGTAPASDSHSLKASHDEE